MTDLKTLTRANPLFSSTQSRLQGVREEYLEARSQGHGGGRGMYCSIIKNSKISMISNISIRTVRTSQQSTRPEARRPRRIFDTNQRKQETSADF